MSGACKNKMCFENSMLHYGTSISQFETPVLDCGTTMLHCETSMPNHGQQR